MSCLRRDFLEEVGAGAIAPTALTTFRAGLNQNIVRNDDDKKHFADKLSWAGAWNRQELTFTELAIHIGEGKSWMPGLLDAGSKRQQTSANEADLLAADIDGGLNILEALEHPFVARYCKLGIETTNSKSEHNKFRLIFQYHPDHKPQGWEQIKACQTYLIEQIFGGTADKACKDASRFFYGGYNRKAFILRDDAEYLPESFVADILAWHQEQEAIANREYEAKRAAARQYGSDHDLDTIEQALRCIPPRQPGSGNYDEWMRIVAALTHELGEAEAIALVERYSPSIKGTTWNVEKKVRSFGKVGASRPAGLGTVFYIAKGYGFRFPSRERKDSIGRRIPELDAPNPTEYARVVAAQAEADRLEDVVENERLLERIVSKFAPKRAKRERRARVEPIATVTTEQPYTPGFLPEYQPGLVMPVHILSSADEQNKFVEEAIAKGWKTILNKSDPGVGKSHHAGLLDPASLVFPEGDDDDKSTQNSIWYLTERSRVPSTETIEENFVEVPTRHQGMRKTEELTPMKKEVWNPVLDPEHRDAGNCKFAHLFVAAGEKNIPDSNAEAADNPICARCPHNIPVKGGIVAKCADRSGEGFGFRYQRRDAMIKDRIRMNPQSAPAEAKNNNVLIWEELGALAKPKVVQSGLNDLNAESVILEDYDHELKTLLRPIIGEVRKAIADAPKYGTNSAQLKEFPSIAALLDELSQPKRDAILQELKPILRPSAEKVMFGKEEEHEVDLSATKEVVDALKNRIERLNRASDKKREKLVKAKIERDRLAPTIKAKWSFIPENDSLIKGKRGTEEAKELRAYHRARIQAESLHEQIKDIADELKILVPELDKAQSDHDDAKSVARDWGRAARAGAIARLEKAHTQTLWDMLAILFAPAGGGLGDFVITQGKITLTLPNDRIPALARSAGANLALDATSTEAEVRALLGVEDILSFKVSQDDANNIQIFQIHGFGKCGSQRRESTNERLSRLHTGIRNHAVAILGTEAFKTAIADHKDQRSVFNAEIGHLQNSRGSNDIAGTEVFIIHGLPKPNWGAVSAEYAALESPSFNLAQYYQQKCDAEFIQEIGRQRAGRHSEKQFLIYVVTEENLPVPAEKLNAEDLAEEAAHNDVRMWRRIKSFLKDAWTATGEMPTQKTIAAALETTQGWISKLVKRFAGGMSQLNAIIAGLVSSPDTGGVAPTEDESFVAAEMMPALATMTEPETIAEEIDTMIRVFGWRGWGRVLKATKKSVRNSILINLLGEAIAV